MKCEGCDNLLETNADYKYGFCYPCRRRAFGFAHVLIRERPSHTEEKDRPTLPVDVVSGPKRDYYGDSYIDE